MPDITAWKDLPYFIAGALALVVLFRTLSATTIKFAEIWQDVAQKRAIVDTKRNEIEERSMNLLEKLSGDMSQLSKRHEETTEILVKHDANLDKQQEEIRKSITEVQETLNKIIAHSKSCPNLNEQIKQGFEELSTALKEIKDMLNGKKVEAVEADGTD